MSPTIADILELTHGMQQDLRAANAKLTTIRSWLAAQPAAQQADHPHQCHCGFLFPTERALAFHQTNVHNGPPVPLTDQEAAA
jgi:hypothetical protein